MIEALDTPEMANFRQEVRSFLEGALTPRLREEAARQTGLFVPGPIGREWHRILFEKGWITPTWPTEFGGLGWTPLMKYIFDQECALAEAPVPSSAGLLMCGPILIAFGTAEQQARFIPRLRSGEDYWCQGYSEPGAGSDLAALSCRATLVDGSYVVNGTKIWTTHAHYADWIFMLVRTDSTGRPQDGITFLLIDLRSPGIRIDPIISMSGDHEVNQLFFDDVHVPIENRVGDEGQGWVIAKRLLEFERSGTYGPKIRRILLRARLAATSSGRWVQDAFRRRYADSCMEADIIEAMELRILTNGGPENDARAVSMLKLVGTETMQRASELCVLASGARSSYAYSAVEDEPALLDGAVSMARYLNARAATIYGGSSEIQRNLLARSLLNLT